jgi:N-methylhydantoinase B/oxoprolinase/acetone carboxylase alpha subunit
MGSSGCVGGGNDHFIAVLHSGPETDTEEAVRQNVVNGYLSLEKARKAYGVVLKRGSYAIDVQATTDLRNKRRKSKPSKKGSLRRN